MTSITIKTIFNSIKNINKNIVKFKNFFSNLISLFYKNDKQII